MTHFAEFLFSNGLLPKDIVADGKWRRCATKTHPKKKNGAYKLADDGRAGWCQDHANHREPLMWRAEKDSAAPKIDMSAIAKRRGEERRALVNATNAAREFFMRCAPLRGGHAYLKSHGLDMTGCAGLKVDRDGWIVIPAMLGRNLTSVQRISPVGDKRFWPGAAIKGASFTINRSDATLTVLCEGLATGLAIYAAVPMSRVVVAFDAGNLPRAQFQARGLVVVAADNDSATEARIGTNPGMESAQKAANAIGCGVAAPTGIAGTDWCDFRQERFAARFEQRGRRSEPAVRRSVDAEIAAAMMRHATFLRSAA